VDVTEDDARTLDALETTTRDAVKSVFVWVVTLPPVNARFVAAPVWFVT
jgi:hypothetical protein